MVCVALSQVSAVGFCAGTTELFVGAHEVADESGCSHESDEHAPSECDGSPEPCDDSHLEIDLEVDDYVRASTETETGSVDLVPAAAAEFSLQQGLRPLKQLLPTGFARPPPDLPVYLRLGVMRL